MLTDMLCVILDLRLSHKNTSHQIEEQGEAYRPPPSDDPIIGTDYINYMSSSGPPISAALHSQVQIQELQAFMNSWAFLRNLGNMIDELYTIDAEFREFLDKEYGVDDIHSIF